MSVRYSTPLLVLCVALSAVVLASTAAAQAPTRDAGNWVVPRTADGHPDLQGNWTNATITRFQREEDKGPVLTWDEVAELEGRAVARVVRGAEPSDPNRAAPDVTGGVGTYNDFYWDRGKVVAIVNGEPRSSLLTNPPDGRRPPFTSEGEQRIAEYRALREQFGQYDNPENRPLGERCLMSFGSSAGPPMIPNNAYNNNYTIVQTSDYVMIVTEMVHDVRIIRLGEPDPLPDHVRPWMGDSWGRWEGDVLVVETTNIHPLQTFRGIPPSKHRKVIERFTRVDEETVLYEFTIDDPETYTRPWGGAIPFKAFREPLYEYSCHEGNYALSAVLSGARYQERQAGRD
ncbi:MAG: hypothetical protein IIB36_03850 [Gemmatimonadetes bacterium]|nr:hypothetical protein [Gemmatimonadota bacterium]